MRRVALVLALLAMPAMSNAEFYQWVDEKGNIGYADDLGNVPAKYRKKATPLGGQEPAVEVIDKGELSKEPSRETDAKKGQSTADEQKPKAKDVTLYAGKDAETWKRDFARQKFDIKSLEDQAAGIRERMANPGKMSRGEYLTLQNTARDLDFRISAAQRKLQLLSEAADAAEVPADLR